MGRLIIIEGGDGSGKATQTRLLQERLEREGKRVKAVSFPNYDSPACMPIKMYLAGEFGSDATSVDPYVASAMYGIDRFASFRKDWQSFYEEEDTIVIADRYTTSNMIHQMVKYENEEERHRFLAWLADFEFVHCGLPQPDAVCLLDVPLEVSERLMATREHKTGGETGDIHEKNHAYLLRVHAAYEELVQRYGWHRVQCTTTEGAMRAPEEIHNEIYNTLEVFFLSK